MHWAGMLLSAALAGLRTSRYDPESVVMHSQQGPTDLSDPAQAPPPLFADFLYFLVLYVTQRRPARCGPFDPLRVALRLFWALSNPAGRSSHLHALALPLRGDLTALRSPAELLSPLGLHGHVWRGRKSAHGRQHLAGICMSLALRFPLLTPTRRRQSALMVRS